MNSRLKLRCGSCYSVHVDERVHVECTEQPRHKARETFNVRLCGELFSLKLKIHMKDRIADACRDFYLSDGVNENEA